MLKFLKPGWRTVCECATHFADSRCADNESEVLLEDGCDDLEEYSNVIQHIGKQPDSKTCEIRTSPNPNLNPNLNHLQQHPLVSLISRTT